MPKAPLEDRRSEYQKWRDKDEEFMLRCLRERPGKEGIAKYEAERNSYHGPVTINFDKPADDAAVK